MLRIPHRRIDDASPDDRDGDSGGELKSEHESRGRTTMAVCIEEETAAETEQEADDAECA